MVGMSDKRVLLVEDSPVYQQLISEHLREWGFEVISVTDGLQAWDILQTPSSPNLAVMDWVMPKMDGIEVCRKLRETARADTYVYTILLTVKNSRGDLLKAMDAGVDDYLAKPFDEFELRARLKVGRRILDLQAELISSREDMRFSAMHDSLTGLLNRKEVLAALRRELSRSKRDHSPVSIVLVDVDHFKEVNDELGHLFGDEALNEVAQRLRWSLRDYDSVGRYGGEEFLLVLPKCDLAAALKRTNQVRERISLAPVRTNGAEKCVTVSMGVAVSKGLGEMEVEQLLREADHGLYKAKRNGRNRVEHVSSASDKTQLDADLLTVKH